MPSSGMLRRVARKRTDVSEESSASFTRVTRIGELGKMLAVPCSSILVNLMIEALRSSESSILIRATRRNFPEDGILQSYNRENVKSYIAFTGWALQRRINVSPVKYEMSFISQKTTFFIVTAVKTSNLT
jgi:hypothetical protein